MIIRMTNVRMPALAAALIFAGWSFASRRSTAPLDFEISSGTWTDATARASPSGPALALSPDWYNDLQFTGQIHSSGRAEILVRRAGETESYTIAVDWKNRRVTLFEDHYGERHQEIATPWPNLSQRPVNFRVAAKGKNLTATFWERGRAEPDGLSIEFGDLKVPEGRVGLAAAEAGLSFAKLDLHGNTVSQFQTYALHCNYKLPDKLSGEPLWQYLDDVGASLIERRDRRFGSAGEFEAYRKQAIAGIRQGAGLDPWPERTPLNARVVGTIERPEFRIEKILFESQPGFMVDALLYVPKKAKFPAPGVLSPVGHYGDDSLFIWSEQGRCAGLARKGYVVLTYDPIGQGERKWLGNGNHDTLRRKIIVSGMEVSGLMFWDSIRGIDYLSSRPEVDPNRIAITGVSGGGFNTIFTAVLDERVKAAAPDGFATSYEALIKRGNAGCCAYLPNLARFADLPQVYALLAPRKLLMLGGYMDVLSDRILPTFELLRRIYKLHEAEESVRYYLDPDAGHTYSKPMRLAMYRSFNEWLRGITEPAEASEARDPEDQLISRESGLLKIMTPEQRGVDVVELERRFLARNRLRYEMPPDADAVATFQKRLRERLIELMGDMAPAEPPRVSSDDQAAGPGSVRRAVLRTERNLPVAVNIYHPAGRSRGNIMLLAMDERNLASTLTRAELVDRLGSAAYTVAVPEVRGTGATRAKDMNSIYLFSMALGKHLFSTRIFDLQRTIDFLLMQDDFKGQPLTVWGEGPREGIMTMYLAAIDPRVTTAISSHGLISYQNIVDMDGLPEFDYYVPGILRYADVPEIISAVAPRRVLVSDPVDIHSHATGRDAAEKQYSWAKQVYARLGRSDAFSIVSEFDLLKQLSEAAQ